MIYTLSQIFLFVIQKVCIQIFAKDRLKSLPYLWQKLEKEKERGSDYPISSLQVA